LAAFFALLYGRHAQATLKTTGYTEFDRVLPPPSKEFRERMHENNLICFCLDALSRGLLAIA